MGVKLSPHGEGYCRHCRFILGLDDRGRLDLHMRGPVTDRQMCKGSGARPARRTPVESRKSRFVTRGEKIRCPRCARELTTLATLTERGYVPRHDDGDELCPGSYRSV